MHKIIFNYHNAQHQAKRMPLYRDAALASNVVYAMLYLHSKGLITINNVLNITEVNCG